jgi:F-type H+-transporting ATPase subunit delta
LKPEDAVAQLRAVDAIFQESLELRNAMLTPAIQNSRKRAVMAKLLEEAGGGSPLIRNFIYVLIDHRRIAIIGEIREAFELQLDERLGFVRAEVTSAAPLDQSVGANLESELSRLTGKRMRLRFDVDPALLGGVVARIGSTVYDGSVRGELRQLAKKLTGQSG